MSEKKKVQVVTAGGAASSVLPSTRPTTEQQQQQQQAGHLEIETEGDFPGAFGLGEDKQGGGGGDHISQRRGGQHQQQQKQKQQNSHGGHAPYSDNASLVDVDVNTPPRPNDNKETGKPGSNRSLMDKIDPNKLDPSITINTANTTTTSSSPGGANNAKKSQHGDLIWLLACFMGIMASFVCYGLLLEYTTSGGRKLHELSFLFVTSGLYTLTAAAGRYVRDETPTTIPPARFAVLGLTSMGSTFCSVRSLRYVIYPIQVLAKSCKPVPVMIMGTFMGKRYPMRKYINVVMIVVGVALFMGGGNEKKKGGGSADEENDVSSPSQLFGILLLFISLCFDGGTGAYEDKLMSVHSVGPFDLMYNIQLGKTILAGVGLLVLNQLHMFIQMVQEMGFLLVALGLSGALGQVFIFVTIAKFGALTCSIIGLARKVTTLVASIYFYGHHLNSIQFFGLVISVSAMVMNFWGKSNKKGGGHGHAIAPSGVQPTQEEMEKMLGDEGSGSGESDSDDAAGGSGGGGDVELAKSSKYSK